MTKEIQLSINRAAEMQALSTVELARAKENPRRGMPRREAAAEFIKLWPIGSTLTWAEFSEWASRPHIGLMPSGEPTAADGGEIDRQSDEWLAHLQRRHQARNKLNKASSHTRIATPYVVLTESQEQQTLVVKSVALALAETRAAVQVASLARTKKRQLRYLIESTDWANLPPYERLMAEALYDGIDTFVESVKAQGDGLQRQFDKLQARLANLVRSGQLSSINGGITAMLSAPQDDMDDDE